MLLGVWVALAHAADKPAARPLAPVTATSNLARTGVSFRSTEAGLQRLFDTCEAKLAANIVQFTPTMRLLVEGGGYNNAWIETQPLGGEMYAKRDIEIALNNQLIFLQGQRADGRLPGMVIGAEVSQRMVRNHTVREGMVMVSGAEILASFEMLQGYCFPEPAWKMYFWAGRDKGYLRRLYASLEAHDAYLWRTRDSNGDGLLETWCVYDTGEDNSTRLILRNAPTRWPFEFPPVGDRMPDPQDPPKFQYYWIEHAKSQLPPPTRDQVLVPFASMDVMGCSYEGRAILARIARELGDGREGFWLQQAAEVRRRLIQNLWDPVRSACFDRDRTGRRLPELIHNNLRCMWYGIFTQEMADAFIRHHLLNPAEFWTPVPLVSIAHNDPLYRNEPGDNWSGQPQGLTFQRAIRALESYGHYAEVSLVGRALLPVLIRNGCVYPQQLDAITGEAGSKHDGYGPMMLAALEYLSRMHGIHLDVANSQLMWSAVADPEHDFTYSQRWGERSWTLTRERGQFRASLNGRELFACTAGVRVVTDLEGVVREVVGIESAKRTIVLHTNGARHELTVMPNQVFGLEGSKPVLRRAVPFDYPYQAP